MKRAFLTLMTLGGLASALPVNSTQVNATGTAQVSTALLNEIFPDEPASTNTNVIAAPQSQMMPARTGRANINTAANRLLGIRYMLGGTGKGGIDCSAYTMRVFQELGIKLPRTAAQQYRTGVPVNSRDLRPGDLVFFNTNGRVASHVGIYLGNGMMANANSYRGKSMIEPLFSNPYWASRYIGARRVLS